MTFLKKINTEKKVARPTFPKQQEYLMSSQNLLILGYGMQGKAALYDCLQYGDFGHIVVAVQVPLDLILPEFKKRNINITRKEAS